MRYLRLKPNIGGYAQNYVMCAYHSVANMGKQVIFLHKKLGVVQKSA
jgi:hypothetical protein